MANYNNFLTRVFFTNVYCIQFIILNIITKKFLRLENASGF